MWVVLDDLVQPDHMCLVIDASVELLNIGHVKTWTRRWRAKCQILNHLSELTFGVPIREICYSGNREENKGEDRDPRLLILHP